MIKENTPNIEQPLSGAAKIKFFGCSQGIEVIHIRQKVAKPLPFSNNFHGPESELELFVMSCDRSVKEL
jgi:hypothetical protein